MKLKIGIISILLSTVTVIGLMSLAIDHIAQMDHSSPSFQSQEDLSVRAGDDLSI